MFFLFLYTLGFWNSALADVNNRPVIGVVTQALPISIADLSPGGTFVASSYVKWLEGAGARVVPLIAGSKQNFTQIFESINGVLIPGGAVSLDTSPYSRLGKQMFELAKAANDAGDYFPIWGTCLGFELLASLSVDEQKILKSCLSYDEALPLNFVEHWDSSRLYKEADADVVNILTSFNVTVNFHQWCLTRENFTKFQMDDFWTVLSVNHDVDGIEFISSMEAKNYPFYATQFHPEKNSYEWTELYSSIPHSREAVKAANYFADFFVSESRRSNHRFQSSAQEEAGLIYNYAPVYTGNLSINSTFTQVYIFDKEF